MDMPKEFYNMVCNDIARIEKAKTTSNEERLRLHREIDGKYQACVKQWYDGLWYNDRNAKMVFYGHLVEHPNCVAENLEMMKAKLETYKYQMNAVQLPKPEVSNSQVVNVTNSVNVNVTFEQVRKEVEEMTSLTNKDTEEILEKISEIEEVVKSKDIFTSGMTGTIFMLIYLLLATIVTVVYSKKIYDKEIKK